MCYLIKLPKLKNNLFIYIEHVIKNEIILSTSDDIFKFQMFLFIKYLLFLKLNSNLRVFIN